MATFSPLKPPTGAGLLEPSGGAPRRRRGLYAAGALLLVAIAVLVAAGIVLASAKASLSADASSIAKIGMPLGGGKVESVSVIGGREHNLVPVKLVSGQRIVARHPVAAGETLKVRVVVKRPGWIAWLAGHTQTLTLTVTTPTASLRSHYLTLGAHAPLSLRFKHPVGAIEYGTSKHKLKREVLTSPRSRVTVPHTGQAGTIYVAAQIDKWETSSTAQVSYFPGGGAASAVANPAPGAQIKPTTPIMLSFSKPVAKVLGSHMPVLTPATTGSWRKVSGHAIEFVPSGYGYGLNAKVSVTLPSGVRLVGGQQGTATTGDWSVPAGSVVRAQQILALLGYLPLSFHYKGRGVGLTASDQENAAVKPPAGKFSWTWSNTPAALTGDWQVGASGVMLQGAIMMFENQHDMDADGVLGPVVWKALIAAVVKGQKNTFGYTFVSVSEGSPESLTVWHSGKTEISDTPVNTGVPGAATATGTFAVFEHAPSVTMSGTNVDGSTYVDPGIPWVSYFNGGDALHGYVRASYGFPQSNGCVEMPPDEAEQVYPYTPIGTLVDVS